MDGGPRQPRFLDSLAACLGRCERCCYLEQAEKRDIIQPENRSCCASPCFDVLMTIASLSCAICGPGSYPPDLRAGGTPHSRCPSLPAPNRAFSAE